MIKILANDGIHADGKLLLEDAGYHVDTDKVPQEKLPGVLPDYDAVIVRSATRIRRDLIDQCPKLRLIARGGVGLDNIDVEYADEKGIEVINTPAASSHSVAELAFAHMFNLSRSLHLANREMPADGRDQFKNLKKRYSGGSELAGKTLGIIGIGRIGQEAARIGLALRMNVLPVDPYVPVAQIYVEFYQSADVGITINLKSVSKETMLKQADFVTIHVPFSGGKPIIGEEEMAIMKKNAVIINTSRGGVVDEAALLKALEEGRIAGAGLDVFENEPRPDERLLRHEKISVSPHIGASTGEAQRNIGMELADKILAFFEKD